MKRLTCEMCGGNDLVKQDGVFVCQFCGAKYSVEEARKMMIEGTVEVVGTVTVDDSAKVENYYTLAENAYAASNLQEAEAYCNRIIETDSTHYKAWLLKGKLGGLQADTSNTRIEETLHCIERAIDNAPEEERDKVKADAALNIPPIVTRYMEMCGNAYATNPSDANRNILLSGLQLTKRYAQFIRNDCGGDPTELNNKVAIILDNSACLAYLNIIWPTYLKYGERVSQAEWKQYVNHSLSCFYIIKEAINLSDADSDLDKERYNNLIRGTTHVKNSHGRQVGPGRTVTIGIKYTLTDNEKQSLDDEIMQYHEKIKEIDPSYEIPARSTTSDSDGGCYVATAVYGSYDCPQVWTLRRFRDFELAETWYGRAFVRTYYAISPFLVRCFGETVWFKKMWRGVLDRMVNRLHEKGYESSPYEDRKW